MEISELKTKSKDELNALLRDKRENLRVLKFDLASGKVKNVRSIRELRKDIARILTICQSAN